MSATSVDGSCRMLELPTMGMVTESQPPTPVGVGSRQGRSTSVDVHLSASVHR